MIPKSVKKLPGLEKGRIIYLTNTNRENGSIHKV
jgi:hypothetical protein